MWIDDSSRTEPLWVWPPPEQDLGLGRNQWQVFGAAVARCGLGVPVTTDDPVPAWSQRVRDSVMDAYGVQMPWQEGPEGVNPLIPDAYLTVSAATGGVAVADLYALAPLVADGGVPLPENTATGLRACGRDRFAQCTVRDMVGWIMAAAQEQTSAPRTPGQVVVAASQMAALWHSRGFGAGGWWFLLGGFLFGDAVAAVAGGSLDVEGARTLAALRGSRGPAGT